MVVVNSGENTQLIMNSHFQVAIISPCPSYYSYQEKKGALQRLVVVKGERVGEDMDWKFQISRCKLVFIEWINKVLLYSTGNYIQYHIINCNEK